MRLCTCPCDADLLHKNQPDEPTHSFSTAIQMCQTVHEQVSMKLTNAGKTESLEPWAAVQMNHFRRGQLVLSLMTSR